MKNKTHPLIYKYLKRYQEDPESRVFAPLAEAYRKAGLVDEAIEIAREGLKIHSQFMSGRVALARALFDKKLYDEVVDELTIVVQDVPDNLVAQKLLGESCLVLGRLAEALSAYKMLLYFIPHDVEIAKIVQELEVQAYEKGTLVLRQEIRGGGGEALPQFDVLPVQEAFSHESPVALSGQKIKQIEMLQSLLQKVERYRVMNLESLSRQR